MLSGGTAIVSGTVANGGTLFASESGSLVEIASGAVVNGGLALIGNGIVDIAGSSGENVAFLSAGSGGLEIADTSGSTAAFSGTVSGIGGGNHLNSAQFIDLVNVTSDATVSATFGGGVLTVSSGTTIVARIHLAGTYSTADFRVSSGFSGTTAITDPGVVNGGSVDTSAPRTFDAHSGIDLPDMAFGAQTTLAYAENSTAPGLAMTEGRYAAALALLGNYMAGSFVTVAEGYGGTLLTEASQRRQQSLLVPPRHG